MPSVRSRLWVSLFVVLGIGCGDNADNSSGASCGDGVVDPQEACDDGANNSATLPDACRPDCTLPACGDGVLDTGEECDDGPANGGSCSTACELVSPTCGDGVIDALEDCDDGANNSDTAPDACRTTCKLPTCGDGIVDAASGEHCDIGGDNSDAPGSPCSTTCKGVWKFVSMPNLLSYDFGDVSTLNATVNSTNTYHEAAIDVVLDSITAEDPDFVLVAGDLVGGNWHADADSVGVFGPVSTLAEKEAAVSLAADTYYPQWLQRFAQRGIPVHATLGDQELGGAPWPASFERSQLVDNYKSAWAKHLTKSSSGEPRYTDRPVGTDFEDTAYAFRHKNMLVLSADVFRFQDGTDIGPQGTVAVDISADQLAWMNDVFTAAAADPTIEYIVVQGHVPVIKPVRFEATNLGLEGGSTSPFWQALAAAGVDLYLSGEVQAMSTTGASGVEQVCHGGALGSPAARTVSYLVGTVYPDRIELELKWIDVSYNAANNAELWQTGVSRPRAELSLDTTGFTTAGTMVIDHSGTTPVVRDRTGYFLRFGEQPAPGLIVHLPLDAAENDRTANLGFSTVVNRGTLTGGTFAAGKLGNALTLASGNRVVAGPPPVKSSWSRTVSAWVKPASTTATISTVLTLGRNANGAKFDVDIDFASGGVVELGIGGARTNGAGSTSVTDGAWHHITMVLPDGGDSLDDVQIYVDGAPISSTVTAANAINTAGEAADQHGTQPQLLIGQSANANALQPYLGELDDVAIWSRGLSAAEVGAVFSLANTAALAYDAGQVDTLLTAFAAQRDVTIGGRTWSYRASGLTGAAGAVVEPSAGSFELNLGGGAGFASP